MLQNVNRELPGDIHIAIPTFVVLEHNPSPNTVPSVIKLSGFVHPAVYGLTYTGRCIYITCSCHPDACWQHGRGL